MSWGCNAGGSKARSVLQQHIIQRLAAFRRSRIIESSDNNYSGVYVFRDTSSSIINFDFSGSFCQFRGIVRTLFSQNSGTCIPRVTMNGAVVEVVAASTAIGRPINFSGSTVNGHFEWIGGEIRDSNGVFTCQMPVNLASGGNQMDVLIDSVIGVTDPSVGYTASASNKGCLRWNQPEGANKGFRVERPAYMVDWKGNGTFPYANAADLRGNGWSHRVTWSAIPKAFHTIVPLRLSRFYRSASAIKTIKCSLYVPDATTVYTDEIELHIAYIDSGGTLRNEVTGAAAALQFGSSRTGIAADATSWTANGVAAHSAKKLELTTAFAVAQNSEIVAAACAHRADRRSPSVSLSWWCHDFAGVQLRSAPRFFPTDRFPGFQRWSTEHHHVD